jgi:hypothetical protein
MAAFVVDKVQGWMRMAREAYSVDPIVFVVLLVACAPFFYFSIYNLVRSIAKKSSHGIALWASVFLGSAALPYLYVLIFGRNMPWWIYIIIGLLVAQGVYTLVKKLRAKPAVPVQSKPAVEPEENGRQPSGR